MEYKFDNDRLSFFMKKTVQRVKNKKLRTSENELIREVSKITYPVFRESLSDLIFEPYLAINFENKLSFKERKLKISLKKIKVIVLKQIKRIICEQNKDIINSFFDEDEKGRELMNTLLSGALTTLISAWPVASIFLKYSIGEKIIDFIVDLIADQLDKVIESGMDNYCKI